MAQISVVIPAYNAAHYLLTTVQSVQNQDFADWELILVNDGSTDQTGALCDQIAANDARIRVIHQKNCGLSCSRNRGMAAMSPEVEFVAFLDADDVYHSHTLQTLMETLQRHPDTPAAHGAARFINSAGEPLLVGRAEEFSRNRMRINGRRLAMCRLEAPTSFEVFVYRNVIWTPGQVLLRCSALQTVDPFDVGLGADEDWDMWIRLTASSGFIYVDKVVLDYRRHDLNMSSKDDLMRESELKMRRKLSRLEAFSPAQRRQVLRGYQLSERDFARQKWQFARDNVRQKRFIIAIKYLVHAAIRYARSYVNRVL
jgi:glycosyltransferase involved in cell wall biosynthesis